MSRDKRLGNTPLCCWGSYENHEREKTLPPQITCFVHTREKGLGSSPATTCHRPRIDPGHRIGTVGKDKANSAAGAGFVVADGGNSSGFHPDVNIRPRCPSCSYHAAQSAIAADPFGLDPNDHTRGMPRQHWQDRAAAHALGLALPPAAASAASAASAVAVHT